MLYDLCERIALLRNNIGITQAELGKRLGVTRSAVNAWEMGFSIPQLKHVVEMAQIFNTTVDGILCTPEKTVVDITALSQREQKLVFELVECLKSARSEGKSDS